MSSMSQLVKAVQFHTRTEEKYRQNPNALASIVNMALFLHTNKLDLRGVRALLWGGMSTDLLVQAEELYAKAYEMGKKHPITLYGFSLLKFALLGYPKRKVWNEAYTMLLNARQMDPEGVKFDIAGMNAFVCESGSSHIIFPSERSFFHWGVIVNPKSAQARSNFALVHLFYKRDYDRAEVLFRQAIALDKTDETIAFNYRQLLENRLPGRLFEEAGPTLGIRARALKHDDSVDYEWHIWRDPDAIDEKLKYFW